MKLQRKFILKSSRYEHKINIIVRRYKNVQQVMLLNKKYQYEMYMCFGCFLSQFSQSQINVGALVGAQFS